MFIGHFAVAFGTRKVVLPRKDRLCAGRAGRRDGL